MSQDIEAAEEIGNPSLAEGFGVAAKPLATSLPACGGRNAPGGSCEAAGEIGNPSLAAKKGACEADAFGGE